jgi:hypothetical protein
LSVLGAVFDELSPWRVTEPPACEPGAASLLEGMFRAYIQLDVHLELGRYPLSDWGEPKKHSVVVGWPAVESFVRLRCRRLNGSALIGPLRCEADRVHDRLQRKVRPIPLPVDQDGSATSLLKDWALNDALKHLPDGWDQMTGEERMESLGPAARLGPLGPGAGKPCWDRMGRTLSIGRVPTRDYFRRGQEPGGHPRCFRR